MDENLQRLAQALRVERCPDRVIEKVKTRIEQTRKPLPSNRMAIVGFAVSLALFFALYAAWPWPDRSRETPATTVALTSQDQSRAAERAGLALSFIGSVLLEAGKHTEDTLLNEAIPPLRTGFDAATKTIKAKL